MNIHIEDNIECVDINDGIITIINKELLAEKLVKELTKCNQLSGDDFDIALDDFWLTIRADIIDFMWDCVEKNNIRVMSSGFL